MGQGARLDFGSWSDGGASNHVITVSQNYAIATASYKTFYQLSASSNPGNGSAFKFSPSSSDMFYPQGTQVTVTSAPNPGFKFGHWTGDLTGSYPSGIVTMSAPDSVVAQMITVPYIAPAGIMNGVGPTPSAAVAPGSIISIFGQSLASEVQVGPVNPLAQTIGGTTVTINEFDTSAALCIAAADQRAASFESRGRQLYAGGPKHWAAGNFRNLDRRARRTRSVLLNHRFDGLCDGVPRGRLPGHHQQSRGWRRNHLAARHRIWPLSDADARRVLPPESASRRGMTRWCCLSAEQSPRPPPPRRRVSSASFHTQFEVPSGLPGGTSVPVMVSINGVDSNTVMLPIQ